mmetsp:Transcript_6870/g.15002  ORF Transcript_6870/g.15002 Transcript_6870/m.15002 type:complete len:257 (+) Transcript_6870:76-846(+)
MTARMWTKPSLLLLLLNRIKSSSPFLPSSSRSSAGINNLHAHVHIPVAMASSSSSSTDYYDSIKSKWSSEYPSSNEIDEIWDFYKEAGYDDPKATLRSMLDPVTFTKNRILDYGCDKGLILDFFCGSVHDAIEGYGLDINEDAIKDAQKRFPSRVFKGGDGLTIPYPDKHFDVVICIATIKHVRYEDRAAVYAELNRVADYALLIEADEKEQKTQETMGWTFYNSNFSQEFEDNFATEVKVVREGGDILGLYECKK